MFWKDDSAGLVFTVTVAVAVLLQSRLSSTCAKTTVGTVPEPLPSPAGSWESAKAVAERDCKVTRLDEEVT